LNGIGFPLLLSLRVALAALAVIVPIGLALGYLQARREYRGRALVDVLIVLPIVLPPSVTGYYLIMLLGREGVLGGPLYRLFGVSIIFTFWAAVAAAVAVALPLFIKFAQAAFHGVDPELEAVARTLGAGPVGTFFRVSVPVAWRGLVAGMVLSFARALGEFGATLMFAGNIPGRTNTMTLEIWSAYQAGDDLRATALVVTLTAVSVAVVLAFSRLERGRW
jgi:molybdate transport system permease protein